MKITIEDRLLAKYHAQLARLQNNGDEIYRKAVEDKKFEQIITERIRRNIRLNLDKGTNIDVEV